MKEELTSILEAMRAAQGELAHYLVSADRNAELTIARLVGILERREVIKAMWSLRALEGPGAPQPSAGRGELIRVCGTTLCENQLLVLQCGMKNPAERPLWRGSTAANVPPKKRPVCSRATLDA